jgi:hypothetical protein
MAVACSQLGEAEAACTGNDVAKIAVATAIMLRYFVILHFTVQNYKKKLIVAIKFTLT